MACSDDNSENFYRWLNEENNNIDFLVENHPTLDTNDRPSGPLIVFDNTDGQITAKCNQAIMMLAFMTARTLCLQNNSFLRFTYIDNFMTCLNHNQTNLCSLFSPHFNLIVLSPAAEIRTAGNQGNAQVLQLHDFCAIDLLRSQVFTYPPLSFTFFFEDKVARDNVFEELKLPFIYS